MEITIKSSMRVTPFLINLIVALPLKMVKFGGIGSYLTVSIRGNEPSV